MYERINGKLYKLVNETEMAKYSTILDKVKSYQEGIATCDKSIAAFMEQKEKYKQEIERIIAESNLDKEELKQLFPEKLGAMGF